MLESTPTVTFDFFSQHKQNRSATFMQTMSTQHWSQYYTSKPKSINYKCIVVIKRLDSHLPYFWLIFIYLGYQILGILPLFLLYWKFCCLRIYYFWPCPTWCACTKPGRLQGSEQTCDCTVNTSAWVWKQHILSCTVLCPQKVDNNKVLEEPWCTAWNKCHSDPSCRVHTMLRCGVTALLGFAYLAHP